MITRFEIIADTKFMTVTLRVTQGKRVMYARQCGSVQEAAERLVRDIDTVMKAQNLEK